jgi:hypothetical protein
MGMSLPFFLGNVMIKKRLGLRVDLREGVWNQELRRKFLELQRLVDC